MPSSTEISPPAGYELGSKFYVRSGRYTVVLTTPSGPMHAAILFVDRAIETEALHLLGNSIEVSENGRFSEEDIILRRETCRFLNNKCGITADLLFVLVSHELYED